MRAKKETLAQRVARLAKAKGLTQESLATEAGLPRSTVQKFWQGVRTNPSIRTLGKLAGPLGVSTDYLITGKHPARRS